jgi:tetratricopeptide (TPR) repeat protein
VAAFSLVLSTALAVGIQSPTSPPVTFSRDVAPILFAHCAACHRPGGGAPFALLSYAEVRSRARLIAQATRARTMPPWKPEPGFGSFVGERRLSDADVDIIQKWIASGSPEGDPRELPPMPAAAATWQMGMPDLIVGMPEAYELKAAGADVFRTFVVPIPVTATRYVRGIEVRPGSAAAVHHASVKIDSTQSSRELDAEEPGPGYDGGGGRTARFPDGHFFAWTPGQAPYLLPDGTAWRLDPSTDLVLELHMTPTGRSEPVRTEIGFFFTDAPPNRIPFMLRLGSQTIDIAPGRNDYVVSDSFVLPVPVQVTGIQPHAHYLARQMKALARLPDGSLRWLLSIKDWDFRWQEVYRYSEPIELPAGTTVEMEFTYDNSAANVRNPNRPPARVTFGQDSRSEMGNLWVQVFPRDATAHARLQAAFTPQMIRSDIDGYEKAVSLRPDDARLRSDLAFLYFGVGRLADARAGLMEALRLTPHLASAHYALATVLLAEKRVAEAEQHLREALRLKPEFAAAHVNLGTVYQDRGQLDAAAAEYGAALKIEPSNAEAHYNLGRVRAAEGQPEAAVLEYRLALSGRPGDPDVLAGLASALATTGAAEEAVTHYRRALAIKPDLPGALIDLAWILATSDVAALRAPDEAIRLAEHAAELTDRLNAIVLDTLAVAYFAADRGDDAVETAKRALDIAVRAGDEELAARIRAHAGMFTAR